MIQGPDEIKMNASELEEIKISLNETEKNDEEKIINVNDVT